MSKGIWGRCERQFGEVRLWAERSGFYRDRSARGRRRCIISIDILATTECKRLRCYGHVHRMGYWWQAALRNNWVESPPPRGRPRETFATEVNIAMKDRGLKRGKWLALNRGVFTGGTNGTAPPPQGRKSFDKEFRLSLNFYYYFLFFQLCTLI